MKSKKKSRPASKKPLSKKGKQARAEKHELFCLEYTKDQNAARAARDAGYSEKTAREMGYFLLTKTHIKARIQKLIEERNARTLLEGDEILLEIKKLATSDIRRLFDHKTGALLPMKDWPDDIAVCVASIEVKEIYTPSGKNIGCIKKLKLWDKPKPQEMLGRNKKLFTDVVESKVNATVVSVSEAEVKETLAKIQETY